MNEALKRFSRQIRKEDASKLLFFSRPQASVSPLAVWPPTSNPRYCLSTRIKSCRSFRILFSAKIPPK